MVMGALDELGFGEADLLGYSMGANIELQASVGATQRVRKLVFMSSAVRRDGIQPGQMDGLSKMTSAMMHGTPFYDEYHQITPRPYDFGRLFEKKAAQIWNLGPMDDLTPANSTADCPQQIQLPVRITYETALG
jgi:pimeloyl-ACP methyl ester carboxylesterase